jgi:hypothetical protein
VQEKVQFTPIKEAYDAFDVKHRRPKNQVRDRSLS